MTTIREDAIGLYASIGGWIARPVGRSRFQAGDHVKTHHFGGTPRHGVGKDEACARGEYLETWLSSGVIYTELYDMSLDELRTKWEWYLNKFGDEF